MTVIYFSKLNIIGKHLNICKLYADAKRSRMFWPNHCKESVQQKDSLVNRIYEKTW